MDKRIGENLLESAGDIHRMEKPLSRVVGFCLHYVLKQDIWPFAHTQKINKKKHGNWSDSERSVCLHGNVLSPLMTLFLWNVCQSTSQQMCGRTNWVWREESFRLPSKSCWDKSPGGGFLHLKFGHLSREASCHCKGCCQARIKFVDRCKQCQCLVLLLTWYKFGARRWTDLNKFGCSGVTVCSVRVVNITRVKSHQFTKLLQFKTAKKQVFAVLFSFSVAWVWGIFKCQSDKVIRKIHQTMTELFPCSELGRGLPECEHDHYLRLRLLTFDPHLPSLLYKQETVSLITKLDLK